MQSAISLDNLTEDEQARIWKVLQRDELLRQKQNVKVTKLKGEIHGLRMKGILRDGDDLSRLCVRCHCDLGIFFNKGEICPNCRFKICKTCRVALLTGGWVCIYCFKQVQLKWLSGEWIRPKVQAPNLNRRLSGSDLVRSAFCAPDTSSGNAGKAVTEEIRRAITNGSGPPSSEDLERTSSFESSSIGASTLHDADVERVGFPSEADSFRLSRLIGSYTNKTPNEKKERICIKRASSRPYRDSDSDSSSSTATSPVLSAGRQSLARSTPSLNTAVTPERGSKKDLRSSQKSADGQRNHSQGSDFALGRQISNSSGQSLSPSESSPNERRTSVRSGTLSSANSKTRLLDLASYHLSASRKNLSGSTDSGHAPLSLQADTGSELELCEQSQSSGSRTKLSSDASDNEAPIDSYFTDQLSKEDEDNRQTKLTEDVYCSGPLDHHRRPHPQTDNITYKKDGTGDPEEAIRHSVEMQGSGTKYNASDGNEGNLGNEGAARGLAVGPRLSKNRGSGWDGNVQDLSASEADAGSSSPYVEAKEETQLRFDPSERGDPTRDPSIGDSEYRAGMSPGRESSVDSTPLLSNSDDDLTADPSESAVDPRFDPSEWEDPTHDPLISDSKYRAGISPERKTSVDLTASLSNARELISLDPNWMIPAESDWGDTEEDFTRILNDDHRPPQRGRAESLPTDWNRFGNDFQELTSVVRDPRADCHGDIHLQSDPDCGSRVITRSATTDSRTEPTGLFEIDRKEYFVEISRIPPERKNLAKPSSEYSSPKENLKDQSYLNGESINGNLVDNCKVGDFVSEDDDSSQVVGSEKSLQEEEEEEFDSLPDSVRNILDVSFEESEGELLYSQLSNTSTDPEDFIQYPLNKDKYPENDLPKESTSCESGISEESFECKINTNLLKDPKFGSPQEAETQHLDPLQSHPAPNPVGSPILLSDQSQKESQKRDPFSGSAGSSPGHFSCDQMVMGSFPDPNSQDVRSRSDTVTGNESSADLPFLDSSDRVSESNNDDSSEMVEVKPIIGSLEYQTSEAPEKPISIFPEDSTVLETSIDNTSFVENDADVESLAEPNSPQEEEYVPPELLGSQQDISEREDVGDDSAESSFVENTITTEFPERQDSQFHLPAEIPEDLNIPQREASVVSIQSDIGTERDRLPIGAYSVIETGSTGTKTADQDESEIKRPDQLSGSAENSEEKTSDSVFKAEAFNCQVSPSDGSSPNTDKASLSAFQPDPLTENSILANSAESLPIDLVSGDSSTVCRNRNGSITEQSENSSLCLGQEPDCFKFQIQDRSDMSDVFPGDAKKMRLDSVSESAPSDDEQSTFDLPALPDHIELNPEMCKETSKELTFSSSPDCTINELLSAKDSTLVCEANAYFPGVKLQDKNLANFAGTEKDFNETEANVSSEKDSENLDCFQKSINPVESESPIETDLHSREDDEQNVPPMDISQMEASLIPQVENGNFSELLIQNSPGSTNEQQQPVEYQDLDIEDPYKPLFNDALDFKKVYLASEDLTSDSGKLKIQFEVQESDESLEDPTAHGIGSPNATDFATASGKGDGYSSESFFQEANPLEEASCFKEDPKIAQDFSQIPNSCLVSHSRHFLEAIPEQAFEDSNDEDAEIVCLEEESVKLPASSDARIDSWGPTIFKDPNPKANKDVHDVGFKRITYSVMNDEDVFEDFWSRSTFPISPTTFSRSSNRSLPEINNRMYSGSCLETDIDAVLDLQPETPSRPCQLDVSKSSSFTPVETPVDTKSPCESGSSEFSLLEYSPGGFVTPLSLDSDASPMSPIREPSHFGSLRDMILDDERLARERFFQFPPTKHKKAPEPDRKQKAAPCPSPIEQCKEPKAASHPPSEIGNTVSLDQSPVLYFKKPDSMTPQRPKCLPDPFAATQSSPSLIKEKPVPRRRPSKHPESTDL